jgi:PTS system mannose-specific IIA component
MADETTTTTSASDVTALIGVVVVTHGQLATELVNAAEMISGDLPRFAAVSIGWHDDVETAREAIAAAIERVQGGAGVLVLTDMFGGTPSNLGMTFLAEGRVEVITGVNLPMLLKLAGLRSSVSGSNSALSDSGLGASSGLSEAARAIRESGRNNIWVASDLIRGGAREGA